MHQHENTHDRYETKKQAYDSRSKKLIRFGDAAASPIARFPIVPLCGKQPSMFGKSTTWTAPNKAFVGLPLTRLSFGRPKWGDKHPKVPKLPKKFPPRPQKWGCTKKSPPHMEGDKKIFTPIWGVTKNFHLHLGCDKKYFEKF